MLNFVYIAVVNLNSLCDVSTVMDSLGMMWTSTVNVNAQTTTFYVLLCEDSLSFVTLIARVKLRPKPLGFLKHLLFHLYIVCWMLEHTWSLLLYILCYACSLLLMYPQCDFEYGSKYFVKTPEVHWNFWQLETFIIEAKSVWLLLTVTLTTYNVRLRYMTRMTT